MALIDLLNTTKLKLVNNFKNVPINADDVLKDSQLDLTDNGPKNSPQYKHVQNYTPNKQYDPNGISNDNLSKKDYILSVSQLDLTGNSPKNYPQYKYIQTYTPNKQYDPNGINNDNLSKKDYMLESSQLDLTGNGPKNYPQYNHTQNYMPYTYKNKNTYLNSLPPLNEQ